MMKSKHRKVLVFGDMLELGNASIPEHREAAGLIQDEELDMVFLVGQETKHTAEALKKEEYANYRHSESKADMIAAFMSYIEPGDLILLKGSRGIGLESFIQAVEERQ
jgi:UDP-N-acetylmuramoyl-tripeptide--D-alanyl-D-alanine ligase